MSPASLAGGGEPGVEAGEELAVGVGGHREGECQLVIESRKDYPCLAASARHTHPARNATPPSGVIAPSQRTPESASA